MSEPPTKKLGKSPVEVKLLLDRARAQAQSIRQILADMPRSSEMLPIGKKYTPVSDHFEKSLYFCARVLEEKLYALERLLAANADAIDTAASYLQQAEENAVIASDANAEELVERGEGLRDLLVDAQAEVDRREAEQPALPTPSPGTGGDDEWAHIRNRG